MGHASRDRSECSRRRPSGPRRSGREDGLWVPQRAFSVTQHPLSPGTGELWHVNARPANLISLSKRIDEHLDESVRMTIPIRDDSKSDDVVRRNVRMPFLPVGVGIDAVRASLRTPATTIRDCRDRVADRPWRLAGRLELISGRRRLRRARRSGVRLLPRRRQSRLTSDAPRGAASVRRCRAYLSPNTRMMRSISQ